MEERVKTEMSFERKVQEGITGAGEDAGDGLGL